MHEEGNVASDFLTRICHLAIVNVCVIIVFSIGNIQISTLPLCFLYLFVKLMITMNVSTFLKPMIFAVVRTKAFA